MSRNLIALGIPLGLQGTPFDLGKRTSLSYKSILCQGKMKLNLSKASMEKWTVPRLAHLRTEVRAPGIKNTWQLLQEEPSSHTLVRNSSQLKVQCFLVFSLYCLNYNKILDTL